MSTEPLQTPKKESFVLVEFEYGDPIDPDFLRLTNWASNVLDPTTRDTYTSLPEMDVKLPLASGLLAEKPAEITLPGTNTLAAALSNGEPHSSVKVRIRELSQSPDEDIGGILHSFTGEVSRARSRPKGTRSQVTLEVISEKVKYKFSLGIVETHHCPWTLGGRGCDPDGSIINIASLIEDGTLATVSGRSVTITGLASHVNRYWHRGYLVRAGLRIGIREWVSGTAFELVKAPPASWEGGTVQVIPGCVKTIETCRAIWNNEEQFAGAGYAMPAYMPVTETS